MEFVIATLQYHTIKTLLTKRYEHGLITTLNFFPKSAFISCTMPVTFNDEPNQGTVYIDPAFCYDASTRLLGRDQHQNNVVEFSSNQPSRSGTPLSEYTRAYSRCGSPNNEAVNALPANIAEVDQACYEATAGISE